MLCLSKYEAGRKFKKMFTVEQNGEQTYGFNFFDRPQETIKETIEKIKGLLNQRKEIAPFIVLSSS